MIRLRTWLARRVVKTALGREIVRQARAEAARQGISNHWKKAGAQCRAMFKQGQA